VLGRFRGAKRDLGRAQPIDRAAHTVRDPPRDEPLIIVERLFGRVSIFAQRARGGMRMRARLPFFPFFLFAFILPSCPQ
jgi:hypothetical protein